jgi:hypothetical protein
MPASISKTRLRKAFNEGRRSAKVDTEQNPYDNPKLRQLWDLGRTQQRSGELTTPIPPLEHGETRAERVIHNPPGSKRANKKAAARPPQGRGGYGGSSRGPRRR